MADAPRRSSRVVKRVIVESSESEDDAPVQPKRASSRTKARMTSSKLSKPTVDSNGLLSKFGFQKKEGMSHVEVETGRKSVTMKQNLQKKKTRKKSSKTIKVGGRSSSRLLSSKVSYTEANEDEFNERVSSEEESDQEESEEDSEEEKGEEEEEEEEDDTDESENESHHSNMKTLIREGSRVNIFYEDDWYKGEIVKELSTGYRVKYDLDGTFSTVDFKHVKLLKSNKTNDMQFSRSGRLIKTSSQAVKSSRKPRGDSTKKNKKNILIKHNGKSKMKKGKTGSRQPSSDALEDTDEEEEEEDHNDIEPIDEGGSDDIDQAVVINTTDLLSEEYRHELAREGWSFGHPLIGQKTRRLFRASTLPNTEDDDVTGGEMVDDISETKVVAVGFVQKKKKEEEEAVIADGVLVAFLAAEGEDPPLWKNYHKKDGEVEDLEYHEVKQSQLNHRLKLKKPRGGMFAGDNEPNEDEVVDISEEIPYSIESSKIKALESEGWIFRTSKNFLWYPSIGKYVGSPSRRFFRQSQNEMQQFTDGVVVAFLLPNSDDPVLYKNYHLEDGELEDLEVDELRVARKHFIEGKEKLVGVGGGTGFYDVLYADDADDDAYDGDPREDDKWYAAIESEDLSVMPSCFVSGEPQLLQSIVGAHSATAFGWHKLLKNYATSKIGKNGSIFTARIIGPDEECIPHNIFEDEDEEDEEAVSQLDDSVTIKKYLIKWKNVSHVHISWESAASLRRVFGARAKTAMNTFVKNQEDFLNDYGVHLCSEDHDEGTAQAFSTPSKQQPASQAQGKLAMNDDTEPARKGKELLTKRPKQHFVNPIWLGAERVLDIDGIDFGKRDPSSWPCAEDLAKKGSKHKVLVKWNGLPYSASTWEFAFEVSNSQEAIQKFLDRENLCFNDKTRTGDRDQNLTKELISDALPNQFENGGSLRDYQRDGVTWMLFNWHRNRSSLLADEMGLGKTLQTVTYLNQLHEQYNLAGPFLVVAPLSTLSHWSREFERWTMLNAVVYNGSAEDRALFRQHEFHFKRGGKQNKFRVIITSFEGVTNAEAHILRNIKWSVLVVDEAHRLKNVQSKFAQALRSFEFQRSLLLTGTPLQNNTQEFWSLLNFLDKVSFQSEQDFIEKFGELTQKEQLDALTSQTSKYMLRRMKEDVEKSVPPKEETRVMVELTLLQKKYYRALYEKNLKALVPKGKKSCDGPSLMNVAMELRKCCNHPFLLRGIRDEVLDQNADKIRHPDAETLAAAGGCMSQARSNLELECLIASSGKLVFLDKLLPKMRKEGHRVLIFSQFKIMLNILEEFLYGRGIIYERLDGDVTGSDRQMSIDRFQDPNSQSLVMLLSTKAGGCGINLVAADTVVIFDSDFNPQNDLQAQSRCHRIGQTRAVTVYRLLCDKTYEMKMIERASHKLALDKAVLGSHGTSSQLTKKEVERLLKQGAYDFFSDQSSDETSIKFCEATIDDILKTNTSVVREETATRAEGTGSNAFASAVYDPSEQQEEEQKAKKRNQAAQLDMDDPNFWTALGLIVPEDDEVDLDSLDRLAEKKARAKRKERQNYKESDLGKIDDDDDDSDEFEDEDDFAKRKKKAKVPVKEVKVVKRWSTKELKSLSNTLNQYGVGDVFSACISGPSSSRNPEQIAQDENSYDRGAFVQFHRDVAAAGPKPRGSDGGKEVRWSEDEVAEMACWLLFTYMLVQEKTNIKPRPQPEGVKTDLNQPIQTTTHVAPIDAALVIGSEENASEAPIAVDTGDSSVLVESEEKVTTSDNGIATTTAATKVKAVQEDKATFTSLLEEYPWCRSVVAALCYYVDRKYKPTPVEPKDTAQAPESLLVEGDYQNKVEGSATTPLSVEESVVQGNTAKLVSLGPLATQFYPLLKKIKKGGVVFLPTSQALDSESESNTMQLADLKTVLMRHIPEALTPANSTASTPVGSYSFGIHGSSIIVTVPGAKKALKLMDDMWYLAQVFKLIKADQASAESGSLTDDVEPTNASSPTLTFPNLIDLIQTHAPSSFWDISHDHALMRSVGKYGLPSSQKKYEICCTDESIAWPVSLDATKGFNGSKETAVFSSPPTYDEQNTSAASSELNEENETTAPLREEQPKEENPKTEMVTEKETEEVIAVKTNINLIVHDNETKSGTLKPLTRSEPFPKRDLMMKRVQSMIKVMKKLHTTPKLVNKQTSKLSVKRLKGVNQEEGGKKKVKSLLSSLKINTPLLSSLKIKTLPFLLGKDDTVSNDNPPDDMPAFKKTKTDRSWVESFKSLPSSKIKAQSPITSRVPIATTSESSPLIENGGESSSPLVESAPLTDLSSQTPITTSVPVSETDHVSTVEKIKLQQTPLAPLQPVAQIEAIIKGDHELPPLKKMKSLPKPKAKAPSPTVPQRSIATFFAAKPKKKPPPTETTPNNSPDTLVTTDNEIIDQASLEVDTT